MICCSASVSISLSKVSFFAGFVAGFGSGLGSGIGFAAGSDFGGSLFAGSFFGGSLPGAAGGAAGLLGAGVSRFVGRPFCIFSSALFNARSRRVTS